MKGFHPIGSVTPTLTLPLKEKGSIQDLKEIFLPLAGGDSPC
jgi:hypothetical protein